MVKSEIIDGIGRIKESLHFEVKRAKEAVLDSMWETHSVFANTDGGTMVFDLAESNGGLVLEGVVDAEGKTQFILNTLDNMEKINVNMLESSDVRLESVNGMDIIVIEVHRMGHIDRPVYINGNPCNSYRRYRDGDHKCGMDAITSMISDSRPRLTDE